MQNQFEGTAMDEFCRGHRNTASAVAALIPAAGRPVTSHDESSLLVGASSTRSSLTYLALLPSLAPASAHG